MLDTDNTPDPQPRANHPPVMEARRRADQAACFHLGRLLELGPTERVFTAARTVEARRLIAGKFGQAARSARIGGDKRQLLGHRTQKAAPLALGPRHH